MSHSTLNDELLASAGLREFSASAIEVTTLGRPSIRRGEQDLTDHVGQRQLALLIYLLIENRTAPASLAAELLDDADSDRSRDSLLRSARWLTETLPGVRVELDSGSISVAGDVSIDARDLRAAASRDDHETARSLYGGEFLHGFEAPSELYREWLEREREQLRQVWAETMRSAAAAAETAGVWSEASFWWRALVERDPLHEDAVARLVLTLALGGDLEAAGLAYTGYLTRLREKGERETPSVVTRVAAKLQLDARADIQSERRATEGSPAGRHPDSFEHPTTTRASRSARASRRAPGRSDPFTESRLVYSSKTAWARLTTPQAVESYKIGLGEFIQLLSEVGGVIASFFKWIAAGIARLAREGVRAFKRLARKLTRRFRTRAASARPRKPVEPSPRITSTPARREPVAPAARKPLTPVPPKPLPPPLRSPVAPAPKSPAVRADRPVFARTVRRLSWRAWFKRALAAPVVVVRHARRYPIAAVGLLLGLSLLLAPSVFWIWLVESTDRGRAAVAAAPRPTLPSLSFGEVKFPDISVPAFVSGPVARVGGWFGGASVERGARLVVADLEWQGGEPTANTVLLGLALESQLAQSKPFSVLPRERVLVSQPASKTSGLALPSDRASGLALRARASALITGTVETRDSAYAVQLALVDVSGEERAHASATSPDLLEALDLAARALRKRIGEPTSDVDASLAIGTLLSPSLEAIDDYVRARARYSMGDLNAAIRAGKSAVGRDESFAAAHRLIADAYALSGNRAAARASLERAWQARERLSPREQLRVQADLEAFAGRYQSAILLYDELFLRYRDDVAALKSQAILQRMNGVPGRGAGNLRIAYSIDPVDWPPLSHVALYLGYRGSLPNTEAMIELASEAEAQQ